MQADVLDRCPDDRQATGLRREHINLIGALTHIAEQTRGRIGRLNVSVHGGRKGIKGQEVIFILSQAADCLGIALRVFGFEGCYFGQCLQLARLAPDAHEFGLHIASLSPGNGIEDIALFMRPASADEGLPK
jgi:hypothetical protein